MSPAREPSRETLPIDLHAMGRDQMILVLGQLLANVDNMNKASDRMDKKLDDLGGSVVRLEGSLREYVLKDQNAHDSLTEKITRIVLLLGDEESDLGIVPRLRKVENAMAAQKNLARGAVAAGIIGGGSGAFTVLNNLAKRFGWW